MTKTMSIVAVIAGLLPTGASVAGAQTLVPHPPDKGAYMTIALGGQPQSRSFGSSGTFSSFGEQGRFEVAQNIGSGFLFDIGGGYLFWKHLGAGLSVWSVRSKTAIAAAAAIPDPVFFGRFTTVKADPDSDKNQSTIGVNLSIMYTMPVAKRFDLAVALGPSIIRNKLDVGSVTVAPNSVTVTSASQSKTTSKAGNFSIDFTYRANELYSAGLFVRYAGGEMELGGVKALKVGGSQVGGLVRYRF